MGEDFQRNLLSFGQQGGKRATKQRMNNETREMSPSLHHGRGAGPKRVPVRSPLLDGDGGRGRELFAPSAASEFRNEGGLRGDALVASDSVSFTAQSFIMQPFNPVPLATFLLRLATLPLSLPKSVPTPLSTPPSHTI